ncbi:hypothetical protein MTO96_004386 [Rhipicephalus appendiculatus]
MDFADGGCQFMEWTTGSTGSPKCVQIPESTFLRQIMCVPAVQLLTPDDVLLGDSNISSFVVFHTWVMGLYVGSTIAVRDIGYYDPDGRLFLCGRLKTMIICQTRQFSPSEVEHCLMEHEAVEEVSVLGIPDPDLEDIPAAIVVPKSGYTRDQRLADDLKRYVAAEVLKKIKKADITHVLTDESHAEMFARIRKNCNIKDVFLVGGERPGFNSVCIDHEKNELRCEDKDFADGGCHFVEWTTGTTGTPKCVENPEGYFLGQIKSLAPVAMLGFPLRLKKLLNAMKEGGDWATILKKSLKKVFLIGSSTPPALAEEFANTFRLKDFRSCYGMTEAGGFLAVPPSGEVSGTNQGFPIPAVRMKVIDPDTGEVLGPMQRGEVIFHTPYAATRYYGNADAPENIVDAHGWIHTGDLGYYDQDGRLFLCDRLKTMLICQTRKFFASEIEHCLMEHEAVEEVSVLGIPSPELQDIPAAVVVTRNGYAPDQKLADDLKSYVAGTAESKR